MGDHDTLFKRVFSVPAHAAGELRSVLPAAIAERLDFSELALVPASFVDPELSHRHADLLFRAPLGGRPSYVYFLFEHQSEPDDLMPWRVLTYQQRIWDAVLRAEPSRKRLPPVVTVVVHHGERGWVSPRRFHALIDGLDELPELAKFVPDFELLIDDLYAVADEALQKRPLSPFPKITLWLLRDGRSVDVLLEHLTAWGAELERLVHENPGREDVLAVLRYILRVGGSAPYQVVRQRIAEVAPSLEESMASAEEQLIQKGIERGIQSSLLRLLRARFGAIDPSIERRVTQATSTELDRWIDRVVLAEHIADVFN